MLSMLFMVAISLSFSFLFLNHPLSFGLILLTETIVISVITGLINNNFWFSYILFLIMVGGMLILFIYMTSVASNEKFKLSYSIMVFLTSAMVVSVMFYLVDQYFMDLTVFNYQMSKMINNKLSMSNYINYPNNKITVMIISYLLITLIVIVKITKIQYGPMRQKF